MMTLDSKTLELQRELILRPQARTQLDITPLSHFDLAGEISNKPQGERLIHKGKVGCILLAGGQGTRLGFPGPKGMYPISIDGNLTLFQLFAEKVLASMEKAGCSLPVAVMTSPDNHAATVQYFQENHLFGLDPEKLDFFQQSTLPILDDKGNPLKNEKGEIITGPDGNGSVFSAFIDAGLKEKWEQWGVEIVNFVPVDNPLAEPFDAELVGYLDSRQLDLAVKAIFRESPEEKVGVLVEHDGRIHVVEYTELSDEAKNARGEDGELLHRCANITLLALNLCEIDAHELPLHLAHKAIPHALDPKPSSPNAWKFEKFIFDIFPLIERIGVLVYPREECFAPLKNLTGSDSVDTVRKALADREMLRRKENR